MAARLSRKWGVLLVALAVGAGLIPGAFANGPSGDPLVALFNPDTAEWNLRYENGYDQTFVFGNPGYVAVLGDWDCDGVRTVGVYNPRSGKVAVRNSNSAGEPEQQYFFGQPGDTPVAGDWDGDGCDSVGVYRNSESMFYVSNVGRTQEADYRFYFGSQGDIPFAGDFDGDGTDSLGVYRSTSSTVYLRNSLSTGLADQQFSYGNPGDYIFVGDWDNDGVDTVGAFRPGEGKLYLSNVNKTAAADLEFDYGDQSWLPSSTPKPAPQQVPTPPKTSAPPTDPAKAPSDNSDAGRWIITWGTTQEQHAQGTPLTNGTTVPESAFFYLVGPDGESAPVGVDSVHWQTNLDGGYQDDGYPWRWLINGAPSGTHWIEAIVNGDTDIRVVFQVGSEASPPTDTTTTESESSNTADADERSSVDPDLVIGPAYKAELGLRPLAPGGNNGQRWATPFTPPKDGTLASIALRWVFADGYHSGDGGHNVANIYRDNQGQPDIAAGPIGSTVDFGDGNVPGKWNPANGIDLSHHGNFNARVDGGSRYWVVIKNIDGGGWTGIDSTTFGGTPPGIDKASFVYLETAAGSSTFERYVYPGEPEGYAAQYELKYDDSDTFGQGYIHGGAYRFPGELGSGKMARQIFNVKEAVKTSTLWVFVEEGSGTVTATLNDVSATATGSGWLEFPIETSLDPGPNSFELSSSGSHTMGVLWDGSAYGWGVGSRVDGYADYHDGSGWRNGWNIWGAYLQQGQMMFAITAERVD